MSPHITCARACRWGRLGLRPVCYVARWAKAFMAHAAEADLLQAGCAAGLGQRWRPEFCYIALLQHLHREPHDIEAPRKRSNGCPLEDCAVDKRVAECAN